MNTVKLPSGESVPTLGLGTWRMGEDRRLRHEEANALRHGLDLGITLIDTAEMYSDAERVVGKAIQGRRDDVFLVSKVLPTNASFKGTIKACENSLKRLSTDRIDLYLLHWSGAHPISETIDAFQYLVNHEKIRYFGVSNFDIEEMEEGWHCESGNGIATNQILYNLHCRGPEFALLPELTRRNMPVMAYSPLNQGRLELDKLTEIAQKHDATEYQIALSWLLHQPNTISIPKSSQPHHVDLNFAAQSINLDDADFAVINHHFPAPQHKTSLDML